MKSSGKDLDHRLWILVTATVRPLPGRAKPRAPAIPIPSVKAAVVTTADAAVSTGSIAKPAPAKAARPRAAPPPQPIEPGRRRRLDRGRAQPAASLDLHGLTQDQARAALTGFILRGWAENRRTILVITGKGALGDGVLRRRVPEWLAAPPLRAVVAGVSEAHRRHGGEGAIYVALKRAEAR